MSWSRPLHGVRRQLSRLKLGLCDRRSHHIFQSRYPPRTALSRTTDTPKQDSPVGLTGILQLRQLSMALSEEEVKKACAPPPPETEGFFYQQTMLRIKDPKKSLDFYTRVMGMSLLYHRNFSDFSLYFLGYEDPKEVPADPKEQHKFCFSKRATLELTHNHGTEKEDGPVYHNGNTDPRGYGHIGIVVPDVYKACERFEKLGVEFQKKPDGGRMKGLAFVKDPDNYWIEIFNPKSV